MLTSFDKVFDYTFSGLSVTAPVLPPVGGDGQHSASTPGGRVAGAVLPFAVSKNLLASCLAGYRPDWSEWSGIPQSVAGELLPFIIAVPLPEVLSTSPYCTQPLKVLNADTGTVVRTLNSVTLTRISDGHTLYIIHSGSVLTPPLPDGVYRLSLGPAVSEPFEVKCTGCDLYRIRLGNDTPLGNLLYGRASFEQVFYVEGDLVGPTYEESETRNGNDRASASVKKVWTLSLTDVSEPIADALALASLHRLVEVTVVRAGNRAIQAMPYSAKAKISSGSSGGRDVELTLPVSVVEWSAAGVGAGCLTDVGGELIEVDCVPGGV